MLEYLDKRDFRRMEVDSAARIRVEGEESPRSVLVKDLSATGVLLLAENEVGPGASLVIEIPSGTETTPPFHARLNVVRCDPPEEGSGLAFAIACAIDRLLAEEEAAGYFS
ncbi:MAG: PilZ domain-containing protein [Sedimenticola sp.]